MEGRRPRLCMLLLLSVVFILVIGPQLYDDLLYGDTTQPSPPPNQGADSLAQFKGHQECGLSVSSIYHSPPEDNDGDGPYCPTRKSLLEAMSSGGRHGFDAAYAGKDCSFKWFPTAEICMILERFDTIVFIGDNTVRNIHSGFNILLRENQMLGALTEWDMNDAELGSCRCDSQFTNPNCHRHFFDNSTHLPPQNHLQGNLSPFVCAPASSPTHSYIPIHDTPISMDILIALADTLWTIEQYPREKLVPIIFHVGISLSFSWPQTVEIMNSIASVLEEVSPRAKYRPVLWLNPPASGHLKPPGAILNQGNEAIWAFGTEMEKEATKRGWDVLGMWNATIQASSWDGTNYGMSVSILQAMMVINWLSRVESV
ncbi:hypothetical protein DFH27DRAFT_570294 [Peziza echinospora]|nr:hypothetical protein DFH27DRAFT_570294 [Peziza echinospora]